MKIEKAIKILEHPPFYPSTPSDKDYANAIKLGIEALKRVRQSRDKRFPIQGEELPGETRG